MAELRPLLDEYERLLEADNALDSFEAAPAPVVDALPAPEPEPEPAPRVRTPRILPAMPSLRTQPGPSALPLLSTAPAKPASIAAEAPPAVREPAIEELEPEPEPERKPAKPSDVRQAILAALEHGSHTIGELVMVTAMGTTEIRTNLGQLARQRKVTRVKRQGDGKSAFALPASSAHI